MIDLKPACRGMIGLLTGVGDEHLTSATPCDEYTVRDLIAHVDEVARGFAVLARGGSGDGGDSDAVAEPVGRSSSDSCRDDVAGNVEALGAAWSEPSAWIGHADAAGVELSNEQWGKIALTEMVVHGWDLAQATGQELELPEETLRACFAHVAEFVPKAPLPELWGPAVDVSEDAPLLDRVVAVTGRCP